MNPDTQLRLFLVRHGETEWTISGRHTGLTDIPLTQHGETSAIKLGLCIRSIHFSHVFTSPLQRARKTCELAGLEPAPEIEPDLTEWNYGDYEGHGSVDIRKSRPGWNVFIDGCPNGETPVQISDRADRLIHRMRDLAGNVALFSSGQFGSVLAARWIGLAVSEGQHFPLNTASLSVLGYAANHPGVPVLELWNAASHETPSPIPYLHCRQERI
jgi:probable phosphoglycerate mutase